MFCKGNDSLGTADKVFFNNKEIFYDAAIKEHSIKSAERYNRVSLHLYDNTDCISNKMIKKRNIMIMSLKLMRIVNAQ